MHQRAREPDPAAARRPRTEAPMPEHLLLALQRGHGNQAVVRMLARKPEPSHLKTEPVDDIGDTAAWGTALRGNQGVKPLYSELATLLHAEKLEDVSGTGPNDINTAMRPDPADLKPGLNFVRNFGSRGQ